MCEHGRRDVQAHNAPPRLRPVHQLTGNAGGPGSQVKDEIERREGSLWGVELPPGGEEWIWELAPRPEIDFRLDVRHRVVGYPSFPGDAWRRRRERDQLPRSMRPRPICDEEVESASMTFF